MCDVVASNAPGAAVHGVVYTIDQAEKATLDRAEGLGNGYAERQVTVEVGGERFVATMHYATHRDPALKPYSWYRAHVLTGAYEHELRLYRRETPDGGAAPPLRRPNDLRLQRGCSQFKIVSPLTS
jgi:gamma-glutamylcyclotransferase (GGCT)/AIG2-like uncharacterized protein YtfP